MAATDDRCCPLASLWLYAPGQGDPVVTDHGFGWYDILAQSAGFGTIERTAAGEQLLEYIEGIGLVCRPFLQLQDTEEARWDFDGGTWEERLPATGSPRKLRLVQLDTTADLEYSATLDHNIPANPSVAFSFMFTDTPPDHDAVTLPPFVRIELGEIAGLAQFGLDFNKVYGARLLAWDADGEAWIAVANLNEPQQFGNTDAGECVVIFRVLRDQLCVSTDNGRSYVFYPLPRTGAGAVIPLKAGPVVVRGAGGMLAFGMHQIQYGEGDYTSPIRNTLTSRDITATATVLGRYSLPTGTAIAFADASTPVSGYARWRATLTPKAHLTSSFTFYSTPELYAAQLTYPVVRTLPTWYYETPWDGAAGSAYGLTAITINKPYELDCSSAKVSVRLDPSTQFTGAYRFSKVRLYLGELAADGTTTRTTASFTGYIAQVNVNAEVYADQRLHLELVTLAERLKRVQWTDFDTIPLGGQTVNQALDAILISEGLANFPTVFGVSYSYRSWHWAGDNLALPAGLAEDPFEWPKTGETKWETMVRIAGYAGLELAILEDGTISSGPQKYVEPWVTYEMDATPATGLKALVKAASYSVDYRESVTAVIVKGADYLTGAARYAYAVDAFAETFYLSDRFCPWRETVQEEVPFPCDQVILAARTQALALEGFPVKYEPEITTPVNLDVTRRKRVRVTGLNVGIGDWDEFAVLTLRHEYRADDPGFARMETQAGLRRVWP